MTKSREGGSNEITDEAKREAAHTSVPLCDILAAKLSAAKALNNTELIRKIIQAQKYAGCRNIRKRGQK